MNNDVKRFCKNCSKEFRTVLKYANEKCKSCRTKKCQYCEIDHKRKAITCSSECEALLRKKRSLERYGVEHPSQTKEVSEKIKKTCIERYGSENPFSSKQIKEKIKETNLAKYGTTNPAQSVEIRNKIERTCQEKHGAKSPWGSKACRETAKENNLEKYGIEHAHLRPDVIEKRKQTNLEKYGVEFQIGSQQTREKSIETLKKNYNVDNPMKSDSIKVRLVENLQKKHGSNITNPSQLEEVQEKIKKTSLKKYGFSHFTQSELVKAKFKCTMLKLYGVENAGMLEATKVASHSKEAFQKRIKTMKERNVNFQSSKVEDKLYEILKINFIEVERHVAINGWDIDFYIKDIDMFVNMNGTYWHAKNKTEEQLLQCSSKRSKTILGTKKRDEKREKWFKENNKKLTIIWEDEINIAIEKLRA
jgi:hypothetical protein